MDDVKAIEIQPWVSVSPNTAAISADIRDQWSEDIVMEIAYNPDPSFQFGSGDRVVVSWQDEMSNGDIRVTIEDCIITRRRHAVIRKETK